MATYQFTIELLPETWAKNNNYSAKSLYDNGQYDSVIAWENQIINTEIDNIISNILPKNNSWSSDLLIWGNEENNDIQIYTSTKGHIESFIVRLDLRRELDDYINKIVSLANELNCIFFVPEFKKIINANKQDLYTYIQRSSAKRFVDNPQKYFNDLPNQNDKNM